MLGGGVLAAREPLLLDPVLAGLAELAPGAEIALVTTPPIVGAALLVLESAGAAPHAMTAARAAIVERFERAPAARQRSASVLAG